MSTNPGRGDPHNGNNGRKGKKAGYEDEDWKNMVLHNVKVHADQLHTILATDLQARLAEDRSHVASLHSIERDDRVTKNLLFNNSHYYQMNFLYTLAGDVPEAFAALIIAKIADSIGLDKVKKIVDNIGNNND